MRVSRESLYIGGEAERVSPIIKEMHEDTETADEAGDIGTADLLTRLVQEHQKYRWFLKEILKKGDQLVS